MFPGGLALSSPDDIRVISLSKQKFPQPAEMPFQGSAEQGKEEKHFRSPHCPKRAVPFSAGAHDKSAHWSPPKEQIHPLLLSQREGIAFLSFPAASPERDFSQSASGSAFRGHACLSTDCRRVAASDLRPQTPRARLSPQAGRWKKLAYRRAARGRFKSWPYHSLALQLGQDASPF